ncbi:hypothetical protein [Rhizobium sp. SGZ-381]|uniref:hypothetical protein n=1 Tax=Rhizobium sp. SGZ-381 TaxID=3342800 RepID=UPI00366F0769
MTFTRSTRLLLASAALAIAATPALALDGNDLLRKLSAAANLQPGNLDVKGIDVTGSTVTLKGLSVGEADPAKRVTVGDVTLQGVVEEDDGSYSIEKAVFPNVNFSEENTTITASDMYLSGLVVPAEPGTSPDAMLFYEEAHAGPMNITVEGRQVAAIKEIQATMERTEDNSGISFDATVDGFAADLSTVDDAKSREAIDSLGLQTIKGTMTMKGSWEAEPGTVDVEEYAIDLDKVGRLNIALSLSGYTPAFIKSMQDMTRAMEDNPNKEAAQQAQMLALFGLLQQLTFNSAELSFTDAGITKRGLSYAGKQQGVSGDQMALMLKGMVPLVVAQWNIPSLQNSLSSALNSFLDKPKNFTVTAQPAAPVPLPMILGAAQAAPNTLPDVLGVTVSANR